MFGIFGRKPAQAPRPPIEVELKDRGNKLLAEGRLPEAEACYRQAVTARADYVVGHLNLGYVLDRQGRRDEAEHALERAVSLDPTQADAWYLLGAIAQARGQLPVAIGHFRNAVALQPGLAEAHLGLGEALEAQGDSTPAIASYRTMLALQPDCASAHRNLAFLLQARGERELAAEHYRQALALEPDHAVTRHNLGSVLLTQGDVDGAIACYREALRIDPDYADAYLNLGTACQTLGDTTAAIENYRRAMAIDPSSPVARHAHSNLIVARSESEAGTPEEYLAEARRYGAQALAQARPYAHWTARTQGGPLRVGFVSGDLRQHPVGYFLENVLAHLDATRVCLVAYPSVRADDALTARIKPRFCAWNVIADLTDEAAAARIHDDGIDVLVDLAGHTAGNRLALFAWKPAPVQASWLGYWASTGVPGLDYFLADPVSVPAGREADFTETIWRLPDTRLCFTAPDETARLAVTPPPATRNGHVTFGCFQNLTKVTDASLAAWGRILGVVPGARVRMQDKHLGYPAVRERLRRRLTDAGIAPERVAMHGRMPREDYLAAYADVDIVLDTFPFCGGTTTCEALWMGVPTLTLAGRTLAARQGASMLQCMGLTDWIAHDEDAYVATASRQAGDILGLARLRATLRHRALASPLFDAGRFAHHLEEALHGMWRRPPARRDGRGDAQSMANPPPD